MMWMRMPGQSWPGIAASFVGMWTVMMVTMMLPSLVPVLLRHRARLVLAAAYFAVWVVVGLAVFIGGAMLTAIAMPSRAASIAQALVVIIAGALQFSPWKKRQLQQCRPGSLTRPAGLEAAGLEAAGLEAAGLENPAYIGLTLGLRCVCCCANLTAILLVIGVMDLRAMAFITAAITIERGAPALHRRSHVDQFWKRTPTK